uniref:Secreted protein n=1 Tax=Setaria viridis TaxID=4556 RepID=A0A4U6WAR4_SETVI|nr:hypothetical protein SEVIR_1G204750v2 [Setaria viridis]
MHIHFLFVDTIHYICVALLVITENGDYIAQRVSSTVIIICCCQPTDLFCCLRSMTEVGNFKMYNTYLLKFAMSRFHAT